MSPMHRTITVFAASADHLAPIYMDSAWRLGTLLAAQERVLVFGGGKTGLMGAVADGALAAGGEVIGIINDGLNLPNLAHSNLTRVEVLPDIHQRQARMSELADAFIVLPGGFGTMAEALEALTWAQIGLHQKAVGFLNINGYYDPLISMLARAAAENFIFPEHSQLYTVAAEPAELLRLLDGHLQPENMSRWLARP